MIRNTAEMSPLAKAETFSVCSSLSALIPEREKTYKLTNKAIYNTG